MVITRYLTTSGWVTETQHSHEFAAYLDARRRCVLRAAPYQLLDSDSGETLAVLTVSACLKQYGVGGSWDVPR